MDLLFNHFGDAASGPAQLGFDLQAFVIQLLTFVVVFLILRKWAFKPIIKMLEERRELIESGVTLGEKMQTEAAKLENAVAKRLHEARGQADQIIADAEADARQRLTAAEEAAQKRADSVMKESEARLKQAVEQERTRLKREVIGLVSEVSEAVIGEKVDAKKDASLVDRALNGRGKPA